jgi:hypothetical protein
MPQDVAGPTLTSQSTETNAKLRGIGGSNTLNRLELIANNHRAAIFALNLGFALPAASPEAKVDKAAAQDAARGIRVRSHIVI